MTGSKLPTTNKYKGAGLRKRDKEGQDQRAKRSRDPGVLRLVSGKVLVRISVQTRLPLAMKIVSIQEYEGRWLLPLLGTWRKGIWGRGPTGVKIVIDRGYLDGEDALFGAQNGHHFRRGGQSRHDGG